MTTPEKLKYLAEHTGASGIQARKALEFCGGNVLSATYYLRKLGLAIKIHKPTCHQCKGALPAQIIFCSSVCASLFKPNTEGQ